ncbi:hypothetical protein PK35_13955 [Tamlana nanhaiensis]|uniref:DUF4136 domain-containing protein n=1 Tax=Neotamlana nanhaiensis TaxID=1382798 RepID=A0A0D7VXJ8_9FLAO|nr:DUF4136 domain-containing protein [Tamlana nanhaiensis]KJD31514.1 hypothetical protein PK35_13955 [Tamlana nanhaiensis]
MKCLKIGALLFLIVACAPIRVNYDYDKTTAFSSYKTYNYYADMDTGLSELDTKRLLDAIDSTMTSKGLTLVENPDFFIDISSSEFQQQQRNTVGVGVGGGGGNVGGGISIGIPVGQAQVNRQITIDFVDENKKQLFWQAVTETKIAPNATPEKREALFNAVAQKVLASYPPEI